MRTVEIGKPANPLARYFPLRGSGPVVFTRRGRPVAALVPLVNTDAESASLSTNPRFLALIERSRRALRRRGGLSADEIKRRLQRGRKGSR